MAYGPLAYARLAVDFRQCTYIVLWCSFCWKPHMHACRWDNRELSLVNTKLQMSFFLWHKSWHLCTCVIIPRTSGYSAVCRYFLSCTPSFFSLSLYNPSRQQRITCSIWSHYFMRTTSTSLHFTYVDLWRYHSKEIVRDAEWTFSCIYMYHQFVYTHWFFFLLLKATKYSSYYILHKASSHQFDQ